MRRKLSEFAGDIKIVSRIGDGDPFVTALAYDSRKVSGGAMFFAWPGVHQNGHGFIPSAVERGASVVVHSEPIPNPAPGVVYLRVDDARTAMGAFASAFHGDPSSSLVVIGVTGTEGKSTTVYLIYQLLRLAGEKAGFISTVKYDIGRGESCNPEHQTTPESTTVQEFLASMRDAGMRYAVVESSSHGLSAVLNRLGDVRFDVGVMMNVTHEHLEFHGTWERYRDDKANLFRALPGSAKPFGPEPFGVVNADDPSAPYFASVTRRKVLSVSTKGHPADVSASDILPDSAGNSFTVREGRESFPARVELPGAFNVDNALTATLVVARLIGKKVSDLIPLLPRLVPVKGRMTPVSKGQPFEVIVDYAHTPSSFETIFPPIRSRIGGKMIAIFGSGGERDVQKRPEQGRIASRYCDVVILADEDPRGEDPMALLEDIAAGCAEKTRNESLFLVPDRRKAIRAAFSMAAAGDIVLLLGKGHENSIIGKDGPVPYDELAEAEAALSEMGYDK